MTSRQSKKSIANLFADAILGTIGSFAGALWFMLAVGAAHSQWIHQLPTISYWTSFLLVWLVTGAFTPASVARAATKINNTL